MPKASNRFDFGDGDFTIMLWMMREGSGNIVLSKGNRFGSTRQWSFGWLGENRSNSASFRVENKFHSTAADAVPFGNWVHVAFVRRGAQGVAEVNGELRARRLAYTTFATMLRKMEDRGLVRHRVEGRRFIYEPAVTAADVTRTMADDLVDRLFEGSLAGAVSHLLRTREISPEELAELEHLIRQQKRRR